MNNYIIHEWEALYYSWDGRLWKYGKLAVCSNSICFFEKNSELASDEPIVSVNLSRITGFQRKFVSFLYKAVVVNADGVKPLWFSSLHNREETYYFMEHFWQQRLLLGLGYSTKQNHSQTWRSSGSSAISDKEKKQQLFEVLYDSENKLSNAADTLFNQGEQLESSSRTINTMHRDLNVAETLLNGLDRWFTKWDIKPEYFYEIDMKKEFPILYRNNMKESFVPGVLVMSADQVTVLNAKRVAVAGVLPKDLTTIIVSTPWNVTLVRSAIGQQDFIIDISSAHVIYIIKSLQHECGDKFEYEESSDHDPPIAKTSKMDHEIPATAQLVVNQGSSGITSQSACSSTQQQQLQWQTELNEADLEEVNGVLGNMKSLALGIGQEMDRQIDRLDQLSESVDKANYRIEKNSRKLRDKL